MYVHYRAHRIESSLEGLYNDVRDEIEKRGWNVRDGSPKRSSWVFPNLAEAEPRSFGDFPDEQEPKLDVRVVDHLAQSDVKQHLDGDFDPEEAVLVGIGTYKLAVQVAKYVLSESGAAVAITESRNADAVDDADIVLVPESDTVLRPLNPVVLENGLVNLVAEELSETVGQIESADASAMARFYSLSVLRSLIVDDGWAMDCDRNLAHDATVRAEDTFEALRPALPELPAQTEEELVGQIESSMESVADEAVGEFLEALHEYVEIVEDSESLDPWEKLEEVVRCVRVLEALEDGDVPTKGDPEVSPGNLEWRDEHPLLDAVVESGRFDGLPDLVRDQERLVQKNDNYAQVEKTRRKMEKNAVDRVAKKMVELANEALEKPAEDETAPEKHGRFRDAYDRISAVPEVYPDPVYRNLFPHQIRRRLGQNRDPDINEADDHEVGGSEDEAYPEFDRTVEVLRSHANHDEVADQLRKLEGDIESRQETLVIKFINSVQEKTEPVVEEVEKGTNEGIPGRKIAEKLDEEFSETPFTVQFERQYIRKLIVSGAVCLFVGLVVGIYFAL